MEYQLLSNRLSFLLIIFAVLLWNILGRFSDNNWLIFLSVLSISILIASCRFKLSIHPSSLTFRITLFGKSIKQKEVLPDNIKQVKFIRTGWAQKAVVIKVHKGFNKRLAVPKPENVYERLYEFAENHAIETIKTGDYLILERLERNRYRREGT